MKVTKLCWLSSSLALLPESWRLKLSKIRAWLARSGAIPNIESYAELSVFTCLCTYTSNLSSSPSNPFLLTVCFEISSRETKIDTLNCLKCFLRTCSSNRSPHRNRTRSTEPSVTSCYPAYRSIPNAVLHRWIQNTKPTSAKREPQQYASIKSSFIGWAQSHTERHPEIRIIKLERSWKIIHNLEV